VNAPAHRRLQAGDELPPLALPPISRLQLALYCGGSGDHNPIHVDSDFAKEAGMNDVFAHGMLSMGFMGRLVTAIAPQSRVKSFGVRFVAITWIGDRITVSGRVAGVDADDPRIDVHVSSRPDDPAGNGRDRLPDDVKPLLLRLTPRGLTLEE
jgi:acyl dehydratase